MTSADSNLCLPRNVQLRSKSDYSHVYANGVRVRGKYLRIVAAKSPLDIGARMGLSVSGKFEKSAVKRNRVRRVLRAAFRLQRQSLPELDLVLIPTRNDLSYRTPIIEDELVELCAKAVAKFSKD
jgi:ribonuclease P protein component